MKRLCENCGQRYEELLCGGICPHCGRYNEPPAPRPEQPEASPPAADFGPKQPPVYTRTEEFQRVARRRPGLIPGVLCCLFGAILLLECMAFPLITGTIKATKQGQGRLAQAGESLYTQQQAFSFGPAQRSVTVGKAETLQGLRGLQQGCTFLRVQCSVKKQSNYVNGWDCAVYLEADGVYYSPLDSYQMEKFYPELALEMFDPYSLKGNAMDEGWLYFAVPDTAQQTCLWLQEQALNRNYDMVAANMVGVPLAVEKGDAQ